MSLTRREFSRLGALGLAARMLPVVRAEAQGGQRKVGYCVIGLGRIADHFMRGVKEGSTSKITGLVSGHRDKAEKIAAQYGVPKSSIYSYEDMDRMRENKSIDAVYVALPNSMHAEYTIRSAKAGKHVLCEKPMSISVKEAEDMIAACKAANVKLMIAYRLRYEPTTMKAIKLVRDGMLGTIQGFDSANGFNIAPGEWRSTKALGGGGSLLDMGIYSLNCARYLTGEEPEKFAAMVSTVDHDGRFDTVEESTAWTMRFPSGALASCSTTYGAQMLGYYKIFGSKGWMEGSFGYDGIQLRASYSAGKGAPAVNINETNPSRDPYQFTLQANHFTECILEDKTPRTPGEEGLRDMQYIDAIYRAAGVRT